MKYNNNKLQLENQNLQKVSKDLQEKVMRQKNKLKGKVQLQGAKHLLWDQISMEIAKVWDYVNFIQDKKALAGSTLLKHEVVNEFMQRRLVKMVQQSIKNLSQTSNESLRILGVNDRFGIIFQRNKVY